MIVEPAMMNAGFVLPEEGYLQGVKDLLHEHGALLVFDEVKTGATLSYGGAVEAFGGLDVVVSNAGIAVAKPASAR